MQVHGLNQSFLNVKGPDSARYLHGMLSCDVKKLASGKVQSYLLLTPKGRVVSYGQILARSSEDFVLSAPKEVAQTSVDLLSRYLISDNAEVRVESEFKSAFLNFDVQNTNFKADLMSNSSVEFGDGVFPHSCGLEGVSIAWSKQEELSSVDPSVFLKWRVQAGFMQWSCEIKSDSLSIDLPVAHAVSFTKGCYMGQEVVAKGTIRGKPPRYLMKLKASEVFSSMNLTDPKGTVVGEITSQFANAALAFVRRPFVESKDLLYCGEGSVEYETLTHWPS
ncbi:hypothetical protein GW915_03475 [bacterium]|nr:hypothetical protein [bacterium]